MYNEPQDFWKDLGQVFKDAYKKYGPKTKPRVKCDRLRELALPCSWMQNEKSKWWSQEKRGRWEEIARAKAIANLSWKSHIFSLTTNKSCKSDKRQ